MSRSVKIVLAVIVGAILLVAGGAGLGVYYLADLQQGARLAQEGYLAGNRGDHDGAIARLNEALRHRLMANQRSSAYVNRAIAYYSTAKYDEAIRDYTEALRINRKSVGALVGRGFSYQQKGELEKALADLTEAIRYDPNAGAAYYSRANLYYERKEIDRALADYDEAVRCDPNNAEALVGRGLCYVAKQDLDHALASFDGAVIVDPENPRAYEERARLYQQKGDAGKSAHDQALALTLKLAAPEKAPRANQPMAANPLGSKLQFDTLPSAAESPQEILFKADLALKAGEADLAIALANKLLAMNISSGQASIAILVRGDAYLKQGNLEKALGDFNESAVLDPMQFRAYLRRALLYRRTKEFGKARADLEEIPRLQSNTPDQALNSVAWIWATAPESELRDGGKAVPAAQRACELLQWNRAAYIDTLAAAYAETGDFIQAIKFQKQAIEKTPLSDSDRKGMKERLALYQKKTPYREKNEY